MNTVSTFSDADIAYIEREFADLRDLSARNARSYETVLREIEASRRPAAAYVLPDGRHFVAYDYFEQVAEKADFVRRYRAECERLTVPVDEADVAETWEAYLTGVYSVCLLRAAPETIAQKRHHMDVIENVTDKDVLQRHVDALDGLERPFCDYDRAFFGRPVSRDTHITAVRARLDGTA